MNSLAIPKEPRDAAEFATKGTKMVPIFEGVRGTVRLGIVGLFFICLVLVTLPNAAGSDDYVQYLGSASADGLPDSRLPSSLFVSPDIIIDYCSKAAATADLHMGRIGLTRAGISPKVIHHILITHSHADHFDYLEILRLAIERWNLGCRDKLNIYGNSTVITAMQPALTYHRDKVELHTLQQFQEFTAGEWSCKSLAATHDASQQCLIYVLRKGDKSLLYATDTGPLKQTSYDALAAERLDLAIVESTWRDADPWPSPKVHMARDEALAVKANLELQGTMKPGAKFALTHTNMDNWSKKYYDPEQRVALAASGVVLPIDGVRIDLALSRSVAEARKMPDHYVLDPSSNPKQVGTVVRLADVVVTGTGGAIGSGAFYVQSRDRSAGIRVENNGAAVNIGDRVDITGILMTDGLERKIIFPIVTPVQSGTAGDEGLPLFLANRCLGGITDGPVFGVTDGLGPNNVGLLVRTSGQVVWSSETEFRVADGSTPGGIKCRGSSDMSMPVSGMAVITGIVSLESVDGRREAVILVRGQQDMMLFP